MDHRCAGSCKRIVNVEYVPPGWKAVKVDQRSAEAPEGLLYYCPACVDEIPPPASAAPTTGSGKKRRTAATS